ncbi:hypothetical protein F5Y01DRAFT_312444 [Xylaria sp. FL0043]|nr:hypothetical protein F5Y01DRAFT_312444 [Xylaria sp. FL0043]
MYLSSVILSLCGSALLSSAYCVQDSDESTRICPLPKCKCPSIEKASGPAVGIALEVGYGTVSIKYNNGTITPVAKIAGSSQYVELMKHLATSPIKHMPDGSRTPPGVDKNDISTRNTWIWYKIKCWARKLIFLPATPEIAILADMVSQLRREAEAVLQQRVKGVAISSPDRVRLTLYEIRDILDYLWMEDLVAEKGKTMFDQLFSMAATAAGHSDGLCRSYTDAYECEKEELHFSHKWTLHLDFSQESFSGAMELMSTARCLGAHADFVDLELGANHHHPHEDSVMKPEYWGKIETRIREFVESNHRPEKIYLTGDSVREPGFLEAVRSALMDLTEPSVLETLNHTASNMSAQDFLFMTSMGAAEFAKRRQEGMAECQLPEECRGKAGSRGLGDKGEL